MPDTFRIALRNLSALPEIKADTSGIRLRYLAWGRSIFECALSLLSWSRFVSIRRLVIYTHSNYMPLWEGEEFGVLTKLMPEMYVLDIEKQLKRFKLANHPAVNLKDEQRAVRLRNWMDLIEFNNKPMVQLDTDVFCFKKPCEILDWWDNPVDVLYNENCVDARLVGFDGPPNFNSGLVCNPGRIDTPSQILNSMEKSYDELADHASLGETFYRNCCMRALPSTYRCGPTPQPGMVTWHTSKAFYNGYANMVFRSLNLL